MIFAIIHFQLATSKYNVNQYSNLLPLPGKEMTTKINSAVKTLHWCQCTFFLGRCKILVFHLFA